ncbi:cation:proton antiporter [Acetobacteraceae bacterium KSS8]|uniref:Cation:proton antiporter n=1 Tax=Endosaccharibacter trunci TaxID=2812733 RepID=A0ABT1W5Q8_9PROT|nr:cation:proton antiporter [Acetobacteraceae bacterium KSS8]
MLSTLVALLLASVVAVPISRRLGFGSVLGYLVGGALIGPNVLGLVSGIDQIQAVSELGVVMLLFLIGLELRPARLWTLRRSVFGLGSAQVFGCAAVLAVTIHAGSAASVSDLTLGWPAAIALGLGLALSSTAIVLPMLGERQLLAGRAGRDGFAVLLFQDLSFIPLVALVPLLGLSHPRGLQALDAAALPWRAVATGIAAIGAILLGGLVLLPRLFRLIGGARTPESFTAVALLTVALTAWLAEAAGLSMSLGAFLAGVLLSNSEYRHELEADIAPFEGLLLGFFFISVGMSAHLGLLAADPLRIGRDVLLLLGIKIAICFVLGRIGRQDNRDALRFALALPQGSEFSFVLFGAAVAAGTLPGSVAAEATLTVALSMAATPILFAASERFLMPRLDAALLRQAPVYDEVPLQNAPVIICGFGRMGQIIGRVLRTQGMPFTALDHDATQVEVLRRFGARVFYGDPGRPEMLRAAGAETAKLLVVTLGDPDDVLRVVDVAQRHFPDLRILARARNRKHAHLLMTRNVPIVRETFHSALAMTGMVLEELGIGENARKQAIETFREHDERSLRESLPYHDDEKRLIQTAKQMNEELTGLFAGDRPS